MKMFNNVYLLFIYLQAAVTFTPSFGQDNYWKDPQNLFPIMAYNYPDGIPINSNVFKVMKQGGINIFTNLNKSWTDDVKKCRSAFDQMNDTSFRWLLVLANENNDDLIFNNSDDANNKKINSYLTGFEKDYIYGTYIWDEPKYYKWSDFLNYLFKNNDFKDINTITNQVIKKRDYQNKLEFVNLMPIYWSEIGSETDYEDYIDNYVSSQDNKPRILSSDIYPLLNSKSGGFRNNYFLNLEILRRKSLQYNIPLWIIVLSAGHDEYINPTIQQIRMQVYCSLAYGAKGIGYYTYSKSWQKVGYKSWILENNFDKPGLPDSMYGSRYAAIKKLNSEIQVLGKFLLQLKPLAVFHSSLYPNNQQGMDSALLGSAHPKFNYIKRITDSNGSIINNSMISFFNSLNSSDNQIEYIMVINKDTSQIKQFSIEINGKANIAEINKTNGHPDNIGNNISAFVSKLDAGEGKLYKINNFSRNP